MFYTRAYLKLEGEKRQGDTLELLNSNHIAPFKQKKTVAKTVLFFDRLNFNPLQWVRMKPHSMMRHHFHPRLHLH